MLTFQQAIQAIVALEARIANWQAMLAAGTCHADDAEYVLRDSIAAVTALRHEHGIPLDNGYALPMSTFQGMYERSVSPERERNERTWTDNVRRFPGGMIQADPGAAPSWSESELRMAHGDR